MSSRSKGAGDAWPPGAAPVAALSATAVTLAALCLGGRAMAQPLVVLDPGHGGTDPGAVGCSLEEADVVLDTAQRLQTLLLGSGVRVALTRDGDTFVELAARAAFANARGADGFFSVHSNSNAGTPATGTETFVMTGAGAPSRALGRAVQDAMVSAWELRDRGLKEANFAVLRLTTMPAALGELGFTNNCSVDATLLRDPAARQRMAVALHEAILGWLGMAPGPATGTLRGVVFQDQGVGTEDLTVRLAGARVTVVETGAATTAAASDAAWAFTLPPGSYTVRAEASGHEAGSRRCDVTAGATTWCSVGLFPEGSTGDAGALDASTGDAGAGDAGAGDGAVDDAGPVAPPPALRDEGGCGCRVVVGRGSGRGGLGPLGLGLALGVGTWLTALGRRRRSDRPRASDDLRASDHLRTCDPLRVNGLGAAARHAGVALALGVAGVWAAGCAHPGSEPAGGAAGAGPGAARAASTEGEARAPGTPRAEGPRGGAGRAAPETPGSEAEQDVLGRATAGPRVTLGRRREWLVGDLGAPLLSPDGAFAALSTPNADALSVLALDVAGAAPRTLCRVARCGWEPRWQAPAAPGEAPTLAYRVEGQSGTAVPGAAATVDGRAVPVTAREPGVHVWTDEDDQAWLRLGGVTRRVGPRGERVMMPTLTADHRHVVLWSLEGGVIAVATATGRVRRLGPGGHPRVDPSGRWLVFERTRDDGHELTASTILLADLHAPTGAPAEVPAGGAARGPAPIRRMPSLSRVGDDGRARLAFIEVHPEGHALVVADIMLHP